MSGTGRTKTLKNMPLCMVIVVLLFAGACSYSGTQNTDTKPTLLILGGTPSTVEVLDHIPDHIKDSYDVISFNRPGFGGTAHVEYTKDNLYRLARDAGLEKHDFGVIGISGGAALAILLASEFEIQHVGVVSGMVSGEAYFRFADSTFTKDVMKAASGTYEDFEEATSLFPNVDEVFRQARAASLEDAIRASFNELNFVLTESLYASVEKKSMPIDWWHGEADGNVAIDSVRLFLRDYPNATLRTIPDADHRIDARIYIEKMLDKWEQRRQNG